MQEGVKRKQFSTEEILTDVARVICQGRSVTLTIRGNSMNPFLVDGRDQVILSPFKESDLKPGAVVLAREQGGRILLHRIIHREGDILLMCGDGNVGKPEQTSILKVMGLLTKVIRKGRYYSCEEKTWKCYSRLWSKLRPIRRVLLKITRYRR